MPALIEDYALIGDCETAALVARNGSIDWLCWPRFDSPACFAALLGSPQHGRWLIAPVDADPRISRRYRDGTLVLETDFETDEGAVTLIDFMPPRGTASDVVRMVVGRQGRVSMQMELALRFDYGSVVPWVTRLENGMLQAVAGPDMVVLSSSVPLGARELTTVAEFTVGPTEVVSFVLNHAASHLPHPEPVEPHEALSATEEFWRDWIGRCSHQGEWHDAITRSLITLKALTYAPTGGIIAAPTTSLPEWIGGSRNWDYRFCWLRDATLTLLSLMDAGYYDEAQAWRRWLMRAIAGSPSQTQIMYGIGGERRLPEWEVAWLPGYEDSRPVRVGNGAANQLQIDVYGEVMDALHQARCGGLVTGDHDWVLELALMDHLEKVWDEPDEGIWEVRGGARHFTHSKVMAWVAFDRAIRSAETFDLKGPLERWRALRDRIHEDVCKHAWNPELSSFVQSYGSEALDASLLVMPLVGFLPPDDPRMLGTVDAIQRDLTSGGFVYRYDASMAEDGLPHGEGTFLACSFWLVDNLVLQGRDDEARQLFEQLLSIRNDVGLLSEEYDPVGRRQLGNFPQAFSHLALVASALNLSRASRNPAAQRSLNDGASTKAGDVR